MRFYRKQHEETVRVVYRRVTETPPDQEVLRSGTEELMHALRRVRERLESLYCNKNENSEFEDSATGPNTGISPPTQSGLVGRLASRISVEQIQELRDGVWFRWTDIADGY